jgi:hypothetical protein
MASNYDAKESKSLTRVVAFWDAKPDHIKRGKRKAAPACVSGKPMEASGRGLLKRQNYVLPLFGILFVISMMFIMDMLMGVHRRLMGMFRFTIAMGYFLMSVLMFMRIFFTLD